MPSSIQIHQLPMELPLQLYRLDGRNGGLFSEPHRHDYYEVILPLSGKGHHRVDFVEYQLEPGRVFLIAPGQVHDAIEFEGELYLLVFRPDFVERDYRGQLVIDKVFYHNPESAPFLQADTEGQTDLVQLMQLVEREMVSDDTNWDLVQSLLKSALYYLTRYVPENPDRSSLIRERMYQLYLLIDEHFREEKQAEFYSKKLSLTSKRVNELCRAHCGKTLTRILHDRILLEAQRDLAFTTRPVKQIAHELGYEDAAYFGRFYRRMTGESPLEFRRKTFK